MPLGRRCNEPPRGWTEAGLWSILFRFNAFRSPFSPAHSSRSARGCTSVGRAPGGRAAARIRARGGADPHRERSVLSRSGSAGHRLLRLHRMFLHAPLAVVRAVGARRAPHQPGARMERWRRFINENRTACAACRARCRRCSPRQRSRPAPVFDRLNARFLAGGLHVPVTWAAEAVARAGAGSPSEARSRPRPHPHPSRARRRDVPATSWRASLSRDAPHHLGGVPDGAGRTFVPLADVPWRRRPGIRGTGRRWSGRRRTCPT